MTFYYVEDDNELEGNRVGEFIEVDGENVSIDVSGIMDEGRGAAKLEEMQAAIQDAINANRGRVDE